MVAGFWLESLSAAFETLGQPQEQAGYLALHRDRELRIENMAVSSRDQRFLNTTI